MVALTPKQEVVASIVAYSLCSGTLVLLNKLTLHYLPFPSLVVAFQLLGCIVMIYGAKFAGYVQVDPLKWVYMKPYLLYTVFFSTGVYCNMRSLNIANVETVIVFRALTPVIVAFLDALFLGREWPSTRSWVGLITLVVGAYGYACSDEKFQTQGYSAYFWPSLYTIIIALEMVCYWIASFPLFLLLFFLILCGSLFYLLLACALQAYGKQIVKSVPLETTSGPVIYTNLLGFLPMLFLASVGKEYEKLSIFWWSHEEYRIPPASIPLLVLGCLVGTGIGYSGWWCRRVVSATTFTLIGVMNKCLTILLNVLIWDQHATPGGILSLFVCIAGGMVYEQSPMRGETKPMTPRKDDEETMVDVEGNSEHVALIEKVATQGKRRG
jgi:drug/metabolite transporter (DMT)-like permease